MRNRLRSQETPDVLVACDDCILDSEAIEELEKAGARTICVLRKVPQRDRFEKPPACIRAWVLRDEVPPEHWPSLVRLVGSGFGILSPRFWDWLRDAYGHALDGNSRMFTDREAHVLSKIVNGLTNLQIAEALGVSASTVKAHVHSPSEKTGLRSRIDLAMWAKSMARRARFSGDWHGLEAGRQSELGAHHPDGLRLNHPPHDAATLGYGRLWAVRQRHARAMLVGCAR